MATSTNKEDSNSSKEPTVLFVDDEEDIINIYKVGCKQSMNVKTATSGDEALTKFDESIDIAFFDRRMPEKTGDELIATLRDDGYEIPMIIVSAVEPTHDPPEEINGYVKKPVSPTEIKSIISEQESVPTPSK